MLTEVARRRLRVVLVGARNPQNIGASARAMQDFGFTDLRIVNSFAPPFEAAQLEAKSAVGAGEVMRSATLFGNLQEAIADCGVVVGTTAIGGRVLPQSVLRLQDVAPLLRDALIAAEPPSKNNKDDEADESRSFARARRPSVALLFGSEKTGLTREQLSYCSLLVTIPLWQPAERHLSMNLGQAVAVCLYELSREGFEGSRALPEAAEAGATLQDRERLVNLVLEAMQMSEYSRRFPANARPEVVRRLVHQLGRSAAEAATWMGFFKLALRKMTSPASGGS